jgi:hypothetical protein
MNTSYSTSENSIASRVLNQYVSGPHWEPSTIPNATTYWRCTSCQRESTREQDLHRERFHTSGCEVRQ